MAAGGPVSIQDLKPGCVRLASKTKQNKTKQNKTKQTKTKIKTRADEMVQQVKVATILGHLTSIPREDGETEEFLVEGERSPTHQAVL